jgi:hypothetical protein
MNLNIEQERKDFEKACKGVIPPISPTSGEYLNKFAQVAWETWQFRAALSQPQQPNLERTAAFADKFSVTVENAFIAHTGEHMDHGAAYAIAEALVGATLSQTQPVRPVPLSDAELLQVTYLHVTGDGPSFEFKTEAEILLCFRAILATQEAK